MGEPSEGSALFRHIPNLELKMNVVAVAMVGAAVVLTGSHAVMADPFNITAAEHAACDADAVRFCMSSYPDVDRMIGCMVNNRSRLTPICLTTFDEGLRRRHIHVQGLSASR
jgi:hypothetical protein